MPMVEGQAAPQLIRELAALSELPCWFGQVTEDYPAKPYLLFSDDSNITQIDPDLSGRLDTLGATIYMTVVDTTIANVVSTRAGVRATYGGDYGLEIDTVTGIGVRIKRSPGEGQPAAEDRQEEKDERGRYPCFAVDAYRVHTTHIGG